MRIRTRTQTVFACVVACLGIVTAQAAASAGDVVPGHLTLIVRNTMPPGIRFATDKLVFAEIERFAEQQSLFFRVNPVVPGPEARRPTCTEGTTAVLYVDTARMVVIADGPDIDHLLVRVSLTSCSSEDAVVAEAWRPLPGKTIDPSLVESAAREAFMKVTKSVNGAPAAARALGLGTTPHR